MCIIGCVTGGKGTVHILKSSLIVTLHRKCTRKLTFLKKKIVPVAQSCFPRP